MLMPGFGQIYNGQFFKGVIFVLFEHFDNILGKINEAIYLDFNGHHLEAIEVTNFEYMLFYPGFYVYAIWDAWFHAKPNANKTTTPIPFFIGGILGELGALFSDKLPIPTLTVA